MFLILQQVCVHLFFFMQKDTKCTPHPVPVCSLTYVLLAEDALCTVLNVGLHHSYRLHRGGCNLILFEEGEGIALLL